ncbi:unnamed protein product, partial [Durusdinium trenchii]
MNQENFTATENSCSEGEPKISDLKEGEEVELVVNGRLACGVVRYVGIVPEASPGVWAGIRLEEPVGKNDGTVRGQFYFQCERGHGIFVRPDVLAKKGDQAARKVQGAQSVPSVEAEKPEARRVIQRTTQFLKKELSIGHFELQGYNAYNQSKLRSETEELELANREIGVQFEEREAEYMSLQMELNKQCTESMALRKRLKTMETSKSDKTKTMQLEESLQILQSEYKACEDRNRQSKTNWTKMLGKLRQELAESESQKTEAVGEKRLAEETAKSFHVQLQQKESELRRSQDEKEKAAKAANDAEEEARRLHSEKQGLLQAMIGFQPDEAEQEDKLNAEQPAKREAGKLHQEECMMLSKLLVKSEQALEAAKKDSASELGKALERHEAQREALALSEQQLSKSRQGVAQMRSQMQKKLEAMEVANAGLKGELATLKEVLDKSRKELAEAESRKTELTRIAQKAARERRSAEEAAKLLQAQLHQKESELSRSQDEIEAAKAANDAEEEARKLNSEKQGLLEASMALQMNQTELEDKAELMQKEL